MQFLMLKPFSAVFGLFLQEATSGRMNQWSVANQAAATDMAASTSHIPMPCQNCRSAAAVTSLLYSLTQRYSEGPVCPNPARTRRAR